MITVAVVFGISITVFFFIFRIISQHTISSLNSLENQRQEVQSRYDFMVSQKKALTRELEGKEQNLAMLQSKPTGIKTISFEDLDCEKEGTTRKIRRYLLSRGAITMKQNEQALKKMETLKMDYLGVCLALGFITLETSEQALKANKLSQ